MQPDDPQSPQHDPIPMPEGDAVQAPDAHLVDEKPKGLLGLIERIGNLLPDPIVLFVGGALLVMLLSAVAVWGDWSVEMLRAQPMVDEAGQVVIDPETGQPALEFLPAVDAEGNVQVVRPRSLLSSDGLFWALDSTVPSFINFPPLGVVLVGMLGIGVAEKTGLFAALLRAFMLVVPQRLFTPMMVFLGIMSSLGLDAGYIVLPPLAAALYQKAGRSPLAGIAAVFAGIGAGFNANLVVTGLDPLLAGFSSTAAQVIDPDYTVAPTANWGFMFVSTFVITLVGWGVSAWIVEPRLSGRSESEGGASAGLGGVDLQSQRLTRDESRGLLGAGVTAFIVLVLIVVAALVPGAPLQGDEPAPPHFARWVAVIVPLIFLVFILPGLVYGIILGNIKSSADAAKAMTDAIVAVAPIIVLAFFAAQFIEYLKYTQLDQMLAYAGGSMLAEAQLPTWLLLIAFILLVGLFNLFIGSMSAKYAMVAPIFIPMLMIVGISPELTQAAYRIGDSVTNTITPLNAYLVIILVFMQKHAKQAGMGTLISMMLPYSAAFLVVWIALLLVWLGLGVPLGPAGPLSYP